MRLSQALAQAVAEPSQGFRLPGQSDSLGGIGLFAVHDELAQAGGLQMRSGMAPCQSVTEE